MFHLGCVSVITAGSLGDLCECAITNQSINQHTPYMFTSYPFSFSGDRPAGRAEGTPCSLKHTPISSISIPINQSCMEASRRILAQHACAVRAKIACVRCCVSKVQGVLLRAVAQVDQTFPSQSDTLFSAGSSVVGIWPKRGLTSLSLIACQIFHSHPERVPRQRRCGRMTAACSILSCQGSSTAAKDEEAAGRAVEQSKPRQRVVRLVIQWGCGGEVSGQCGASVRRCNDTATSAHGTPGTRD